MELLAVFTTVSSEADAEGLARGAIEKGLAACVQWEPIQSVYRWKGRVEQDSEIRLLFKTTVAGYGALQAWLAQAHPYELPAIFALPVQEAAQGYREWVSQAVAERQLR